jgi:hypothetical protein
MLRVNNLSGFGGLPQFTTLRQANFLVLPTASRVAIDGTGGFPDIGGNVGAVVNRGVTGGSLNATSISNRGTLQSVGVGRLSIRGNSTVQLPQIFTASTPSTVYSISAFIPRAAIQYERILSLSLNSTTADHNNTAGAALLLRDVNTTNWGVYRNNSYRGSISTTINVLTIFETIVSPTETRISKDGAADVVTSYGSLGNFDVSSFRFLTEHDVGGSYTTSCNADVLVAAVFFTNPSTEFRARALSEVRSIAGIATP